VGDFDEAGDVGAFHVVHETVFFAAIAHASVVDRLHDGVQTLVHFTGGPGQAHGVLAHFQAAGSYAAGVGCLARRVQNAGVDEQVHRVQRRRHVGAFGHAEAAVLQQRAGVVGVQFVL